MSLTESLTIGRSALTATQLAIQVAGNNVANASTPGYSRQTLGLTALPDSRYGTNFVGRGVGVQTIRRQVDSALQQRLYGSISQDSAAQINLTQLGQVEATLNELSGSGLSTQLGNFFNSWSELANSPNLGGSRSLVVQQGTSLAAYMKNLRGQLSDQKIAIDRQLTTTTGQVNSLLDQVAAINASIVQSEQGSGAANGLRDRRDQLISELSQYADVSTVEQPSGVVDVLIGSSPVVLAGTSRGLQFRSEAAGNQVRVSVATRDNNETLTVRSGELGALLGQRTTLVDDTIDKLDTLAGQLIAQVNRVHSTGLGGQPFTALQGQVGFASGDITRSLNDPTNTTSAAWPVKPTSGSFTVRIRNETTGDIRTATIRVDLDGLTSTLAPGYTSDTSLSSLSASLGAVPNLSSAVTPDGKLSITAASGYSVSFGDDSSGVLAAVGINTYFTGKDASDIGVRAELVSTPNLLAAGTFVARNGGGSSPADPTVFEADRSDNGAALRMANLRDQSVAGFGGSTINQYWDQAVQSVAVRTSSAKTEAESTAMVKQSLDAQRTSVSGVSMDEEAISLVNYQRQYQASARFITVVDDMTQTLLGLIR